MAVKQSFIKRVATHTTSLAFNNKNVDGSFSSVVADFILPESITSVPIIKKPMSDRLRKVHALLNADVQEFKAIRHALRTGNDLDFNEALDAAEDNYSRAFGLDFTDHLDLDFTTSIKGTIRASNLRRRSSGAN